MLDVVPSEGVVRRFLTGPVGAEITGFAMTPDARTLFVNVQHPGEPLAGAIFTDPSDPTRWSLCPDGGRPRSGTVVITKDDGGVIGT
jgi:secreted PhoX family phosphatase